MSLANEYPFQSSYVFAANSPIRLIDVLGMGPGDPMIHLVQKGDNLSKIARKYGVSISDLKKMNNLKSNKIMPNTGLYVNPEANFSDNPRGGYENPDNPFGVETEISNIAKVGTNFNKEVSL